MRTRGLALLFCVVTPCWAWGPEGHAVVAQIAAEHLSPRAQAQVAQLLRDEPTPTLASVASWADTLRPTQPITSAWHYVNFHDGCHYDSQTDCPDGQCIVAALDRNETILADTSQSDQARTVALKFVVHLTGDIAQPLHASDRDDKGGNRYQVQWQGRGTNLHHLWDGPLVAYANQDADALATELTQSPGQQIRFVGGAKFDPATWAEQSCQLIDSASIYPAGHNVGDDYANEQVPVVKEQLQRAGERLAAEINQALDP